MKVSAVVPAAGASTRVGLPQLKQFWPLDRLPLVSWTIRTLLESYPFLEIVVAFPPDSSSEDKRVISQIDEQRVRIVEGGSSRHHSIYRCLEKLNDCDIVVVHDAVRPFVEKKDLINVIEAAAVHGAAGCVNNLVDTVLEPDDKGFLKRVLMRSDYVASVTPQAFQYDVLAKGYQFADREELEKGTECLNLALMAGSKVKLVSGSPNLWKVTYKKDLLAAEGIFKERERKYAIVTGGSRGIGWEVAKLLSLRGVNVAILDRDSETLFQKAAAVKALPLTCDVSIEEEVEKAFDRVTREWGRLDIVVNNAGIAERMPLYECSTDRWRRIMGTNLDGAFYVMRNALQIMKLQGKGVIVNILSSALKGGRVGEGVYAASKAGLLALTQTAALEARPFGVDVFGVAPQRTNTLLRRELYPGEDPSSLMDPMDVAEIIVFCCLERLTPLTGQVFWLNKG